MAFSADTRRQALVAAARHCCVCQRYKGVKVEVHHIIAESEGGGGEFTNAIVLCFDCHADAGHYNRLHPRGTKFSPEELRAARDAWYQTVREHRIQPPREPDYLYCRYLVCKDFEVLREIAAGDLSRVPVGNVALVENGVFEFLRTIIVTQGEAYRHAREWGEAHQDEGTYLKVHPDAVRPEKSVPEFAYFDRIRVPSGSELAERVAPKDGVTRLLLEAGVSTEEVSRVVAYWEQCGQNAFQEVYRLRPLWGVFLAVTNLMPGPITLVAVEASIGGATIVDFRAFDDPLNERETQLDLPRAPLGPGMTALIPVATVLASLHHTPGEVGFVSAEYLQLARRQELAHVYFRAADVQYFRLWGPTIRPRNVKLLVEELPRIQELHELDLLNLYTIDRSWEMGSCPHVFFVHGGDQKLLYAGELFAASAGVVLNEALQVPASVRAIIIAELEHEITYLRAVMQRGRYLLQELVLSTGEFITLSVEPDSVVEVSGFYVPEASLDERINDAWRRNEVVGNFLAGHRRTALDAPSGA